MPLPAAHFRPAQSVVKTVFAPPRFVIAEEAAGRHDPFGASQ